MSCISQLNNKILTNIPITNEMGVEIIYFNGSSIRLSAPLHKNINDKGTAFAGSIYSLLVLSSWALIEACLEERGIEAEVMVTESNVIYKKAISSDFEAEAFFNEDSEMSEFLGGLKEKGRTRVDMSAQIISESETFVTFKGSFFVKNKSELNHL